MPALISERELEFLLYEFLDCESLPRRARYAEHSRESFAAVLDLARHLANEYFAPHYASGDERPPVFREGKAEVIAETSAAWKAFAEAGFAGAHWDSEEGGLQLPEAIFRAAMALFFCANVATATYPFLTIAAANLLRRFGTPEQKRLYLEPLGNGRFAGTMALTEPAQGSSLADIKTTARRAPDGTFRLFGQKMFISGGDQDFTENIVHMVLARIDGSAPGAKGISLFLVPKFVLDASGCFVERNDVALAGLLHKMGWRNTTSTVLSFGDERGATGYLLGAEGEGLAQMFSMMNEARIGVGLMSASLAYSGFTESLAYARERRQGRVPSRKDARAEQNMLVEHADIRRQLLAQKVYSEGSLALCLYASSLFEDQQTHPDAAQRAKAALLLDVLTPVVKSWPAKYGCRSNDIAIQVLGGAGYTRDFPLEQLYRDQRLNPVHEGTEGIQALDLLGRKVSMQNGAGLTSLCAAVRAAIEAARAVPALSLPARSLDGAVVALEGATRRLNDLKRDHVDLAQANATVYLDVFGAVVMGWVWLKQALVAFERRRACEDAALRDYYDGKVHAARYYFDWELPVVLSQLPLVNAPSPIPFEMRSEWF